MNIKQIWTILLSILLFLMIWASGEFINIKIVLCGIVCFCGLFIKNGGGRIAFSVGVGRWFAIYIGSNIFFMILSILHSNPGAFTYINVDLVEPILFAVIIVLIGKWELDRIGRFLIYISLFLYVYLIIGFLSVNDFIPISNMPFIITDFGGLLPFGLMKADAQFIQWLYFLIPGNICLFFFREEITDRKIIRIIILNFILSYVATILILKTALILVSVFTIILSLVLLRYKKNRKLLSSNKLISAVGLLILTVVAWNVFNIGDFVYDTVLKKVMISLGNDGYVNSYGVSDIGGTVRRRQIADLLNTWRLSPILGRGTGADSLNYTSSTVHGLYEMTYVAKLMQRGIVGMMIYIGLIGWMFKKMLYYIKHDIMKIESLYLFAGLAGMLLANGTNPYLESFDKLIILFLPLVIVNIVSLNGGRYEDITHIK